MRYYFTEKTEKGVIMLIDPHVHSKAISFCSIASIEEIIDFKKSHGYAAAVSVNHCQPWYYAESEHKENMQKHIDEYLRGKAYAEKNDFKLFLGIEVTVNKPFYADFLLYGVTEEFLLNSPCLYALTHSELYEYCHKNGVVVIQAHPFRAPIVPASPSDVDGYEINCQKNDLLTKENVLDLSASTGKLVTAGTDYHGREQDKYLGGMIVPDDINSATDFANYLNSTFKTELYFDGQIVEAIRTEK